MTAKTDKTVRRLNYIGSKYQLLEWLEDSILQATSYKSFSGKRVADLFAGTGIVTHHFRKKGAITLSNDVELYSSVIARAFNTGAYTSNVQAIITNLVAEINAAFPDDAVITETTEICDDDGYVTRFYSPHAGCERMFFTPVNARIIDYVRRRIQEMRGVLCDDEEHNFLLASLLVSADAVSNVASVYGSYLKKFKATALRRLVLCPIHTVATPAKKGSTTTRVDVLSGPIRGGERGTHKLDVAYIDPPYNERQYSKNYFPLNQIAKEPSSLLSEPDLKGKTGIPQDCFISPFCRKNGVADAFKRLVENVDSEWVFISYNTEGLLDSAEFQAILEQFGEVNVVSRPYKRFKSYSYNGDKDISEILFCLHKTSGPQ